MERNRYCKRREGEILEAALAAAGAAIFASLLKRIVQWLICSDQWRPKFAVAGGITPPAPLLFLLLHVVVASIVLISTHPQITNFFRIRRRTQRCSKKNEESKRRRRRRFDFDRSQEVEEEKEMVEKVEELNARAEAFIEAFRRQLRLDSLTQRIS